MPTLNDYINGKRQGAKKIPADIIERWNTRIMPRNLHTLGADGAAQYLSDYGRGIAAPKVVHLALQAEANGCKDMALGFWRKAYELEIGITPPDEEPVADPTPTLIQATTPQPATIIKSTSPLPEHLQPGRLVTMQPMDAPHPQEWYVNSPLYWGQPKRDGNRRVIIATPERIFYQSRSTKLHNTPSIRIERALKAAVANFGPFILDGELYYADYNGGEHRTGAQAVTANIALNQPLVNPEPCYAIFKALFYQGRDLTTALESERIQAGDVLGQWLQAWEPTSFEVVPTACNTADKSELAETQQRLGREGEVWVRHDCHYVGGKAVGAHAPMVRTKYLTELEVKVVALTPTTAEGRPFGAIEVAALDGKLLGSIGTGFDSAMMREIARRHQTNPGAVHITIATQGFTENGQVWHGRFVNFAN